MNKLFIKLLAAENADTLGIPKVSADQSQLQNALTFVFMVIGGLAVIFIIIGGFQYVVSGGDPTGTGRAKETILYAVIGLVISILSLTIINFVVGLF